MKNKSIFRGWYETDTYRAEKIGHRLYRVYERSSSAFILRATVTARSYVDAISKAKGERQ